MVCVRVVIMINTTLDQILLSNLTGATHVRDTSLAQSFNHLFCLVDVKVGCVVLKEVIFFINVFQVLG